MAGGRGPALGARAHRDPVRRVHEVRHTLLGLVRLVVVAGVGLRRLLLHSGQNSEFSAMLNQIKERSAFCFSDKSIFKGLFYIFRNLL